MQARAEAELQILRVSGNLFVSGDFLWAAILVQDFPVFPVFTLKEKLFVQASFIFGLPCASAEVCKYGQAYYHRAVYPVCATCPYHPLSSLVISCP